MTEEEEIAYANRAIVSVSLALKLIIERMR